MVPAHCGCDKYDEFMAFCDMVYILPIGIMKLAWRWCVVMWSIFCQLKQRYLDAEGTHYGLQKKSCLRMAAVKHDIDWLECDYKWFITKTHVENDMALDFLHVHSFPGSSASK